MLLASTDSLTGLANRRRFDETMECEWTHAIQDETSLGLLMIDADRFKLYNDANAHQAGDCLLQAISRCIAAGTRRASDFAARYGGEEFAVLLPGLDAKTAFNMAERIRAKVVNLGLKHWASPIRHCNGEHRRILFCAHCRKRCARSHDGRRQGSLSGKATRTASDGAGRAGGRADLYRYLAGSSPDGASAAQ
jgi:diguanylate cyclase (GGDEF)-like protein